MWAVFRFHKHRERQRQQQTAALTKGDLLIDVNYQLPNFEISQQKPRRDAPNIKIKRRPGSSV
jgi:hypothetical protein